MKKNIKILLGILIIIAINIIFSGNNFSMARVITNDPTVESGNEVKITVTTTNAVSCFKIQLIDAGGLTFKSVSKNSVFDNGNSNGSTINGATTSDSSTTLATYIFKAPDVTENKKFIVKFSVSGMDNEEDVQNTSTVTVKPKEQIPQNPTNNISEPKFTQANKTMYSTGDINLRASWSTSSGATQIKKGTELKVVATSTNQVNGYVWYKVNYNGETKYVASSLLTSTKPSEILEKKKNNNANLKSLTIDNQELMPTFSSDITKYTMEIANDITELNIKAEAENEKSTVEVKGNSELKEGENIITISVTAEDGTIKVYEIKVTKLEKLGFGLKSLKIKDTNIEDSFKFDIYEYEIEIKDVEKLEIEAIANVENATIEILGNEDLKAGENIITIIVSTEDEETVTYQIKANKVIETNANPIVNNEQKIDSKIFVYIAVGAIVVIILIIIIIYIIKHKDKDEFEFDEYENDFERFSKELPEKQKYTEETNSNIEDEVDIINNQIISNNIEYEKEQERKSKLDYFLDIESNEKTRRGKGKHF